MTEKPKKPKKPSGEEAIITIIPGTGRYADALPAEKRIEEKQISKNRVSRPKKPK